MKGGGEHGKHAWVESASSIGRISYVSVQTFEPYHGPLFRAIYSRLRVKTFAHISPHEFLCALSNPALARQNNESIELTTSSFGVWRQIEGISDCLPAILKELRKRN